MMGRGIVLSFFLGINTIAYLMMLYAGTYLGDLKGISVVSNGDLSKAFLLICFSYVFVMLCFFKLIEHVKFPRVKQLKLTSPICTKISVFVLIFQISFLLYNFSTGLNVAGSDGRTELWVGYMFILLSPDALFLVYYAFHRESKFFKYNVSIFVASNLLRGWIGPLLIIIIVEAIRYLDNKRICRKRLFHVFFIFIFLLISYPILTQIKFSIRAGSFDLVSLVDIFSISEYGEIFYDSLVHLVGRFQLVSYLAYIFHLEPVIFNGFLKGEFLPFYLEGLQGRVVDLFFDRDKSYSIGVALTEYFFPNLSFEYGAWNTNPTIAGWFVFLPAHLILGYILYISLLSVSLMALLKGLSPSSHSYNLLWSAFLLYLIPGWFGAFSGFLFAFIMYGAIRLILSIRIFPCRMS